MSAILRLGTRGSALALTQSGWVRDRLQAVHADLAVELVVIRTQGDIMAEAPLAVIGGKGVFVKDIEAALLRGDIDLAVHSLKDMPSVLPDGLSLGAVPEREDPRDVWISGRGVHFSRLTRGARIGTGAMRRGCQIRNLYPDAEIVPLRGNLDTRLQKMEREGLDGIVLAAAGMRRMGWLERVTEFIPTQVLLPAIGQGALALETRADDTAVRERLACLHHEATAIAVTAERAFLKRFGGGCQMPIAAFAELRRGQLAIQGLIGDPDGCRLLRADALGDPESAETLGTELAERLLTQGGQAILDMIYSCGGGSQPS